MNVLKLIRRALAGAAPIQVWCAPNPAATASRPSRSLFLNGKRVRVP